MDEIHDSPTGWVAKHIKQYVESDGAKGHQFHGAPTLLLTTTGRKSGLQRRTALIYGRDGDDYVIVASLGGSPTHPLWYLNLVDEPKVGVQVQADRFDAVARTATAEEKARLWPRMVEVWPAYEGYQNKTSREIPVVILSRR
ncbi:nitroreductase family deazaflavin-dependent oxidoreductase [Nonomuraea soli]|uniref:Deazaflavin-dependent oxidoreductase (Nitroreductase family) n=1 Tax=Nonomuraea soli TaxID=1032476 RepID=A0A7W0CP79_9ACTN|nr:nitroreductase family deazaflavin-dependent oxidoreductase [Nonomuraea soli]MBA2894693.1 deazaflavin-dependent oxidoreductase (nitroreductase family) [Nonomuraea soli]